jgi:hypothetical protein
MDGNRFVSSGGAEWLLTTTPLPDGKLAAVGTGPDGQVTAGEMRLLALDDVAGRLYVLTAARETPVVLCGV